ncbi:4-hydroxy-tetrahydrodipicolinate reductase [Candidatus Tremblayella endosymbiont of Pseudococcus viburni]
MRLGQAQHSQRAQYVLLSLAGCAGRMGALIRTILGRHQHAKLVAPLAMSGECRRMAPGPCAIRTRHADARTIGASDALVDFSRPRCTMLYLRCAAALRSRMVIGTTGLCQCEASYARTAAQRIGILMSANTSVGVTLFRMLCSYAARLYAGYDFGIVEVHHRHKRDVPSGTAIALRHCVASTQHGVSICSLRGGGVVGDHAVFVLGESDVVVIEHRSTTRLHFATGAVEAAVRLCSIGNGLYDMQGVLGLSTAP